MKKFLSSFITLFLCQYVFGQFTSSLDTYCYVHDYTDNDGVLSKPTGSSKHYIWVNFQKDMMGVYSTSSSASLIKKNLNNNSDYYSEKAIKDVADHYASWKNCEGTESRMQPPLGYMPTCYIYSYCSDFSSKYVTYRKKTKSARMGESSIFTGFLIIWDQPEWGKTCYSFSKDHSTLLFWETDNTEVKKYYKLIDENSIGKQSYFIY